MNSPLRWPGGKSRLAATIVAQMSEHWTYVETCCGAAWVFWAKPRDASRAEVLNDADGELMNFYGVLHKRGRRLAREVDSMPYGRAWFARVRDSRPASAFGRAVRFWYLNRVSFGPIRGGQSFGVKCVNRGWVLSRSTLTNLDAIIERLRGVTFEAIDVVRLVELYDRPATLFYVDPPYVGPRGLYAKDFGPDDHRRLAAALGRAAGHWLLSYDDCRLVRQLYRGFPHRRLTLRYSIRSSRPGGQVQQGRELLISNRPFKRAR